MSEQRDWVSLAEEVLDEAVADTVDLFADLVEAAGDRPFGFEKADRLTELYEFVIAEADLTGQVWRTRIAQYAQQTGQTQEQAEKWAWAMAPRLARAVMNRAGWNGEDDDIDRAFRAGCEIVQRQYHYREEQAAARDVLAARRIMDLPKAVMLPAPVLLSPLAASGLELAPDQLAAVTGAVGAALAGGPGPALAEGVTPQPLWPIATYGPNRERPYSDYPADPSLVPQS